MKAVLVIPLLPGKALNPNWRGHWVERHRDTQELKGAARMIAATEFVGHGISFKRAAVTVEFVIRDRRGYKDPDNALACLKPAIDGCVAAGLIPDDDAEHIDYRLPLLFTVDKARAPMTILTFTGERSIDS